MPGYRRRRPPSRTRFSVGELGRRVFPFVALLAGLAGTQPPGICLAQSSIRGDVRDRVTGTPLSGATIQVEGTFAGTITNENGRFALDVTAFPATLIVRFIGYVSASVTLADHPTRELRIELDEAPILLPEITVTGEDPAINIMRKVIERKAEWRARLLTYRVQAYNRFRLENDSGIVSIWESGTTAFWDKDRGIREIGVWQRQTANVEVDEMLPAALFMQNLYDDDIDVAGHRFMGVTHPDALETYRFRLAGSRTIDDRLVYDIDVEPMSKLSTGFVGRLSVLDDDYVLLDVDLEPGAAFYFPMPIDRLTVRYRQQFSNFGSDVWLPADLRSSLELDLSFQALLSFPTIRIEQLSRFSGFELNADVPDSLFEKNVGVVADSISRNRDRPPASRGAAVPLTTEESEAYQTIDSTLTMIRAYPPTGLLAGAVKMNVKRSESRERAGSAGSRLHVSLEPSLWMNKVEGAHLGAELAMAPVDAIRISGSMAWQAHRSAWSYGARARLDRGIWMEAGYSDGVVPRYGAQVTNRLVNSVNVLVSLSDYYDYLKEKRAYVAIGKGRNDEGWLLAASYERLTDRSVVNHVSRGLIGPSSAFRPNAPVDEGTLQVARAVFGYRGDSVPGGIGPDYSGRLELETSLGGSIHDLGRYTRASISVVWRLPTFFRRRLLPNVLDFRVAAGTSWGRLPRQRFGVVDGSTIITTFGGLRTRRDHPYEGEKFVLFVWEHSFRTVLFEVLGWERAIHSRINLIVFGGHGRTWTSGAATRTGRVEGTRGFHHEIGLSVSGLFGVVRLDVARRLDRPEFAVGLSAARIF